jgi:hypothetical protein
MRTSFCIALALPVLIAATGASAQQQQLPQPQEQSGTVSQSGTINQMSEEAIAARRECFEEAKIRAPGQAEANSNLATLREQAYKDCAVRKGVRP